MIKLNDDLLQELGLNSLPLEEKKKMLAHIYETLEMRVGMKLAQQMTDEQLDEFEQFIKNNDEAGALHWLETKFPHYKDVVSAEFENLKVEIRQVAPQVLASAMAAGGQTSAPQQPMPQPQVSPQPFAQQPQPGQWPQQPMPPQPQQSWQATQVPQQPAQQPQGGYGYSDPQSMPPQPQQFGGPQPQQPMPTSQQPQNPAMPQMPQPQVPPQAPGQPYPQQPGSNPAPWPPQDQQQPPMAA
jgi:hypothetical protein